jgi:phospholipase C
MQYPDTWQKCAIFISWDDWGGYDDHVVPPTVYNYGYSPRVPGIMISQYAKQGMVDHQALSHDAYLKFIEDRFCNSNRLGGDSRPTVREDSPFLGDLLFEFDFNQSPR